MLTYTYIFTVLLISLIMAIRLRIKKTAASKAYLGLVLILLVSSLIEIGFFEGMITYPKTVLLNLLWTNVLATLSILLLVFAYVPSSFKIGKAWLIPVAVGGLLSLWFIASVNPRLIGENGFFDKKISLSLFSWLIIHKIFIELLLAASLIVIIRNLTPANFLRSPALYIGIAIFVPLYVSITSNELPLLLPGFQLTVFASSTLVIGIALSLLGNKQLFLSRNYIFNEVYIGGWVLIDPTKRIADLNMEARRLLRLPSKGLIRKDAIKVLSPFPAVAEALKKGDEVEMRTSTSSYGKATYVHLHLMRIQKDNENIQGGYLLFSRDETKRKQMDIARQQTRDEMFGLLHSIAGAASESESSEEFINTAMHQINHSFNGSNTLIFLSSSKSATQGPLPLIGQIGIEEDYLQNISFLNETNRIISYLVEKKRALLITESKREKYLPQKLSSILMGEVLAVPILDDDILSGVVFINKNESHFRKDEIARIETAVQEMSSFINSERRRHAASTLAERQRLIRDLHDSVTQRLYSLVMMTEAARLEQSMKKEKSDSLGFIEEFGFSARQALKEMRLFLYKMQPLDIRGGFPNLLVRRLDAVEGRAGLEIDLNVDESIRFSDENELHLYMIAQEALNNIIKHANASKIAVHYKKTDGYISLIIHDNGDGFSMENAYVSGLGMRNIKERVEIIGGTMRLKSNPGKGTTLTVLIPEAEAISPEVANL